MPYNTLLLTSLTWRFGIAIVAITTVAATATSAFAGCSFNPIIGGQSVTCTEETLPDPSPSIAIPSGNNVVQVLSGSYAGFTIPGGKNNTTVAGGSIGGDYVTGDDADSMNMTAGSITGNVNQNDGADTFTMSGGTVGSVEQGGGLDIFRMTGGTIIGAFTEGDFVTIMGGTIGSADMTIANNVFDMSGGKVLGDVVAGFQNDTFTLSGGTIGGKVNLGNGKNALAVSGGQIDGGISTGNGVDILHWSGGLISSTIALGAGNDTATLSNLNSANLTGTTLVDGGTGDDHLVLSNTAISEISRLQNWEAVDLTDGTRMAFNGDLVLGDTGSTTRTLSIDATSSVLAGNSNLAVRSLTGPVVTVFNAGTIDLTNGSGGATDSLTIVGSYAGAGGALHLDSVLGSDGAPSDKLIIDGGSASGSTSLHIFNAGGAGAVTPGNGILVVDTRNGGTTEAGSFGLAGRVAAGPYSYSLYRSSVDGNEPDAWYLRSTIDCSLDPNNGACAVAPSTPSGPSQVPNYRPETSLYTTLPTLALLYNRTLLDTFHERSGEQQQYIGPGERSSGQWARLSYLHGDQGDDARGIFGDGPAFDYDFTTLQVGQDVYRSRQSNGSRQVAGAYFAFGTGQADVRHYDGTDAGRNRLTATTGGAYWSMFSAAGAYLDAVAQGTWFEETSRPIGMSQLTTNGPAVAASLEAGIPFAITGGWVMEPQIQAAYQNVDLRDTHDSAASVEFDDAQSLAGRVGVRIATTWVDPNQGSVVSIWIRPNIWNEFLGDTSTAFSSATGPIAFGSDLGGTWFDIDGGVTAQINDALSLFASAAYQDAIGNENHAYDVKGGLRIVW